MKIKAIELMPSDLIKLGKEIFAIHEISIFANKDQQIVSIQCINGDELAFPVDKEIECISPSRLCADEPIGESSEVLSA